MRVNILALMSLALAPKKSGHISGVVSRQGVLYSKLDQQYLLITAEENYIPGQIAKRNSWRHFWGSLRHYKYII